MMCMPSLSRLRGVASVSATRQRSEDARSILTYPIASSLDSQRFRHSDTFVAVAAKDRFRLFMLD